MGLWYKSRAPFSSLFRSAVRTHDSAGRERSIVDFSSTLARRFINKIAPKEMHQRRTNRRRVINIAAVSNQATRDMKPWKIDTSKQIYNEWFANRLFLFLVFLSFFSLSLSLTFSRILDEAVLVAEDERGGASIQIVKRKCLASRLVDSPVGRLIFNSRFSAW